MKQSSRIISALICLCIAFFTITGCGKTDFLGSRDKLKVEEVDPNNPDDPTDDPGDTPIPGPSGTTDMHALFKGFPGQAYSLYSAEATAADGTGKNISNDYDGDGISNDIEERDGTNEFVSDYPRIVTRISAPITMEIRISETVASENHSETIQNTDMKQTITNSMEDRHYAQLNEKTIPVGTDKSANNTSDSDQYGYSDTSNFSLTNKFSIGVKVPFVSMNNSLTVSTSTSKTTNSSVASQITKSSDSERKVFENVDFSDNLDRNGVEFKDETVQNMSKNYRTSAILKQTEKIGPNDGFVRAGLYLKNVTIDMPVLISNVVCTLSFRTPSGEYLPVKTFRLRNEDFSLFSKEVYGGQELGPYTIEVEDLNTNEVRKALANGYIPQIHVVSYDMHQVEDSNYNPGTNNLKIVEETAKKRTATIKITGPGMRELYRVCAFDVAGNELSPGISLKKALFNIFRKRIYNGENWDADMNGNVSTVTDENVRWKTGGKEHTYSSNTSGNAWDAFETYVKTYTDEYNNEHRIEVIKRIGEIAKYNPFDPSDNPAFQSSEVIGEDELLKMKYWIILHNGRYYDGDLNDPIWAGERYEIICVDIQDFNKHFTTFSYTPFQSQERFSLNTRWNRLSNQDDFARARYLGKVLAADVVHLEVDLQQNRFLFNADDQNAGFGTTEYFPYHQLYGSGAYTHGGNFWYNFNYSFADGNIDGEGIPEEFSHTAQGGTNNITVKIDNSKFAHSYRIKFYPVEGNNTPAHIKTIEITKNELLKQDGVVTITSQSLDIDGNEIGEIPGALGEGKQYRVMVSACGVLFGVPVETGSVSLNVKALVKDALTPPSAFSFGAQGAANGIVVKIQDSENAEFYRITVQGPLNPKYAPYLNPAQKLPRTVIVRSGMNILDVANPPCSTDELISINENGVYLVTVYAHNDQRPFDPQDNTSGVLANNIRKYVTVSYERYYEQKKFAPGISSKRFDLRAIDLEVNFNDGSGWYRLQLDHNDTGQKIINCRYSSYMEFDKQKFHVFFQAPNGSAGTGGNGTYSGDNVFTGGRQEVDVYIRTVAAPDYRDTIWVKPAGLNGNGQNITYDKWLDAPRFVYVNSEEDRLKGKNPITHWLNLKDSSGNDLTDASRFEETIRDYRLSDTVPQGTPDDVVSYYINRLLGVADGSFIMSDKSRSGYFFSPKEEHTYFIKASLTDSMLVTQGEKPAPPTFTMKPGVESIKLYNIYSQLANTYQIFWRQGKATSTSENIYGYPWTSIEINAADAGSGDVPYLIGKGGMINGIQAMDPLAPNTEYTVCMVAKNRYGVSDPGFLTSGTGNSIKIMTVTPYSESLPEAPKMVAVQNGELQMVSGVNRPTIIVNGIYVPGEINYEIQWKTLSDMDWQNAQITHVYGVQTFKIIGLKFWDKYQVRVRAYRETGDAAHPIIYGKYCDSVVLNTQMNMNDVFNVTLRLYSKPRKNSGYIDLYFFVENIQFPEETESFKVSYNVKYGIGDSGGVTVYEWAISETGYFTLIGYNSSQPIWLAASEYLRSFTGNAEVIVKNKYNETISKTFNFQ